VGLGFLKQYVTTAYIGIIIDSDRCDVYIKVYKKQKLVKFESHTLRMEDGALSRVGIQFLNGLYKQYYFVYMGTLLLSINQGAFGGLGKQGLDKHEIRQVGTKLVEIDKMWTFYASETDLNQTVQDFANIGGLDFIFSSYSVISSRKTNGCHLYILKLHGFASIAVFDGDELLYGNFFMFVPNETSFGDGLLAQDTTSDTSANEHSIDTDGLDDMFGGDIEDASNEEISDNETAKVASLEKDTKLIEFTKVCLQTYYKNPIYDARFIDKIIVFDPYNESEEFRALAEEELMLPIEVVAINLAEIICEFSENEALDR